MWWREAREKKGKSENGVTRTAGLVEVIASKLKKIQIPGRVICTQWLQ